MRAPVIAPPRTHRQILHNTFDEAGYEFICVAGVKGALEAWAKSSFQMIRTAYILEDGASLHLCQTIRVLPREACTPIVMLSSCDAATTGNAAYGAGVTELSRKQDMARFAAMHDPKDWPPAAESAMVVSQHDSRPSR